MALRREDLSAEALERQAALDRSWADAQRALADPAFRSGMERALERLDAAEPAPVLTRAEFLARTLPVEQVPLRDIEEYHAWVGREVPTVEARRVVRHFLAEIGDEAWRAPSVPIAELSQQPEYEVRAATLIVAEQSAVQVWYRHFYTDDTVDVVAITGL